MSFEKDESNIFYIYFQVIKKYKNYMERGLEEYNLTPAEIDVLSFLVNNREKNNTASDISMRRGISKGLVSRTVQLLKEKDLIYTKANPDDGRSVYLILKDTNKELIGKVENINDNFRDSILKDMRKEDINMFLKINNKMLTNIKDM